MSAVTHCRIYGCQREGSKAGGRIIAPLCPKHFEEFIPKDLAAKWMTELSATGDLSAFQYKINKLLREKRAG